MLFNSFEFIFGFLPLALAVTYLLGRFNQRAAKFALLILSLGFYAWWRPAQLPLLLGSIVFNFVVGALIQRALAAGRRGQVNALLAVGVLADVAFLGWFKYANFIVDNINYVAGAHILLRHIALPLAISFFTFQKIAYLIDTARGETKPIGWLDFSVFAAFFPQLISGPIVHFKEIVPQLQTRLFGRLRPYNLVIGLVLFSIGLFKKTVIADTLAIYTNPLIDKAIHTGGLNTAAAWGAALGYLFQLYFDFSGYSDMAIGLGRLLGVKLPLNFHSPLRASNITDYWRRWHMTLQRFIVAYIFQPLSLPLNRWAAELGLSGWSAFAVGVGIPTFVTFVVIGVWHGAGWTFAAFGAMHAIYVCTNETWREASARRRRKLRRAGRPAPPRRWWDAVFAHGLTLLAVIFADVMFRAPTIGAAVLLWKSMLGLATPAGPPTALEPAFVLAILVSAALTFLAPNTQQIMGRYNPALNWRDWRQVGLAPLRWTWRPSAAGYAFAGVVLFLGVIFIERGPTVFLYFNF